jgi:hypothetical protein
MSHAEKIPKDPSKGWAELGQPLSEGLSLSGREPNSCFLNLGGWRFADISAVSGLDYIDDGRAAARVDWDSDGDLDLWVTNRSAPKVRFLRNDIENSNHFVAFQLIGQESNRDGIGARVEVELTGASSQLPRKITKSLRAGEGFLAQSSKWLHFGLGDATAIPRVTVRWPQGRIDEYRDLEIDRRYRLTEKTETPENIAQRPSVSLPFSTLDTSDFWQTSFPIGDRMKFEELEMVNSQESLETFRHSGRSPLLISLWSVSCDLCREELEELGRASSSGKTGELGILALSVDGPQFASQAEKIASRLNLSFPTGVASQSVMSRVRSVLNVRKEGFVIPTSLLLDRDSGVARIYEGRTPVAAILADLEWLSLEGTPGRAGRWYIDPRTSPDAVAPSPGRSGVKPLEKTLPGLHIRPNTSFRTIYPTNLRGYFQSSSKGKDGERSFFVETRLNSLGFRGGDLAPVKSPGAIRIFCIGDSLTMGAGVLEEDTFVRKLENHLGQSTQGPGNSLEIIDCGLHRSDARTAFLAYRDRVRELQPDFVCLTFSDADRFQFLDESWLFRMKYLCELDGVDLRALLFHVRQTPESDAAAVAIRTGLSRASIPVVEVTADLFPKLSTEELLIHPETDPRPNEIVHGLAARRLGVLLENRVHD